MLLAFNDYGDAVTYGNGIRQGFVFQAKAASYAAAHFDIAFRALFIEANVVPRTGRFCDCTFLHI